MVTTRKQRLIVAIAGGILVFGAVMFAARSPVNLLGRILEGDELLRVQVESDFDRDGDIDFLDFTVFSAFYEEA
ncbi:MAG TPA: hypothetical protein VJB82_00660 [Candidatus Peribacterales bacterium]|nr:hypothetical protein [Candidatus Peribacterales bacterium]